MATLDRREAVPVWCRLRIPHSYRPSPVLSTLASRYGLDINITTARLGVKDIEDGWFELVMNGQSHQVLAGLRFLKYLQVEIAQLGPKLSWANLDGIPKQPSIPARSTLGRDEPRILASTTQGPTIRTYEVEVIVPPELRHRPVLFSLVNSHHLSMTIVSALLEPNSPQPGHFELVLSGTPASLEVGLSSLRQQALIR